jgi:hypothetical protein
MPRLRRWADQRSNGAFGPGDRFANRAQSSGSPTRRVNPRPSHSTERPIDRNCGAGSGQISRAVQAVAARPTLSQKKLCRVL